MLLMDIDAKERMKVWENLQDPKPSWETFKRIGFFGLARWRRNFKKTLDEKSK